MKIIELEVKSQHEASVKDGVATVDVVVVDRTTFFEQAMEVVTTLQEDPKLQRLKIEIHELQQ